MNRKSPALKGLLALVALVAVNAVSELAYTRWDLTEDHRFTLAPQSIRAAEALEGPVGVQILLDGELPPEFARLQQETRLLLEQFAQYHRALEVSFTDPMASGADDEETLRALQSGGLRPASVTVEENNRVSQEVVFPWALVTFGDKTEKVALLKNQLGASTEERVNASIQNLEYAFADAFTKLGLSEKKTIAVLKGNGQLADIYLADYLTALKGYYNLAPFTLDSVDTAPEKTVETLKRFDAVLMAKPTEAFTEAEKYVLDQYMVSGGKSLWLLDGVAMELDSLLNRDGEAVALPRDLGLGDLLFRYGIRLNPNLVNDLYATQIVLAAGEGNNAQYDPVPWVYHPMVFSREDHPINTNTEALRMQFASSIDTLPNPYRKTVLYASSPLSRVEGTPKIIGLDAISREPDRSTYTPGNYPLAVLVEGRFTSAYKNRVRPLELPGFVEEGPENRMIVIGDGDLVANQLRNGRPLELGYDKWTNNFYGNREFLVNAMNYLLEDTGLINIRNKKVSIPLLDPEKIAAGKTRWQLLNIGIPVGLILLLGVVFNGLRRRRYGK
ncbi:gliding motility-associated ABC transporter substrate-binding protein GldG [Robiginitalea marina]|uniref:Gliding motility-associated ABC transporter substrate-binding protein GldG n=1 Tax=Robiginitalea marina TaxID=2954105 RepID=A0ABT1AVJ5_9FLAO|nr:gliding motility-associated ABC transporter substrate-binding protein GldG [Robiginitalea marina]MCO5723353.1 gliding motility-associated ABC transporter substrate-binding protein GldG [Robiginitalea marina]